MSTESGSAKEETLRPGKEISVLAVIVLFTVLAISTRLLPLSISSYPFNNDGLSECQMADDIIQSGHLEYPEGSLYSETHGPVTPVYNILLASASSSLGVPPLHLAQFIIAMFSVLSITGVYIISRRVSGTSQGAMAGGLVLALFGTFVFATASTWKMSLGVALFILLIIAYIARSERRMLVLEIVLLLVLPLVHHVVALVAYLTIGYLTVWSLFFAVANRNLTKRHLIDLAIIGSVLLLAYGYYLIRTLDRLYFLGSNLAILYSVFAFLTFTVASLIALSIKRHASMTFAPIPALLVFVLFIIDYGGGLFPYESGAPSTILLLGGATSLLIFFAWYGLELAVMLRTRYRAVPMGLLAPLLTVMLFAVLSGFDAQSHFIFYRTFDLAAPAFAVSIAVCVSSVAGKKRIRGLVIALIVVALLVTLPFGYATGQLTGVRHDTQAYEIDALVWIRDNGSNTFALQSDERISYMAMAMNNIPKTAYLPERLVLEVTLGVGAYYVVEDEWVTEGVNDYPRGNPKIDSEWMSIVLQSSDVLYVGGPRSDRITVFVASLAGQSVELV